MAQRVTPPLAGSNTAADEAPICGADGKCGLCTYAGDKGLPW